jgi:hypothetical protein
LNSSTFAASRFAAAVTGRLLAKLLPTCADLS